jgi:hypothetical protein
MSYLGQHHAAIPSLASDDAACITGEALDVSGGRTIV